jgi:hypothetical protein
MQFKKFPGGGRLAVIAAIGLAATGALASGDNVKSDVMVNGTGIGNTIQMTLGETADVDYYVQDTGQPDTCLAPVSIELSGTAGTGASETSFQIPDCTTRHRVTFTPTALGTYDVTVSGPDEDDFNLTAASIKLKVVAPGDPGTGDTSAPSVTYVLDPSSPNGSNGWYVTDVKVIWTITDGESTIDSTTTGCGAFDSATGKWVDTVSLDQADHTRTCSATSAGGTSAPVTTSPFSIDQTAPTISGAPTTSPNGAGWYNGNVTIDWTCGDATSTVATCPADSTISAEGEDLTASGTAYDVAGNSTTATSSPAVDIDKTPPALNITGAPNGSYDVCAGSLPSRPSFAPTDGLSGLDGSESDSWTTPSTASGVGTYTYSAHAQDLADNSTTGGRTYTVTYGGAFNGPLQPVNADGSSRFKLGSTVPIKFRLMCGTTAIPNAVAALTVKIVDGNADPGVDEVVSTAASTTGNLFRYDTSGQQYIFNLNTKAPYTNPGTGAVTSFVSRGTYQFTINLDDGTTRSFVFQLIK